MAQGRSTETITMIKWIRTSRLSIKELSLSGNTQTWSGANASRGMQGGVLGQVQNGGRVLFQQVDCPPYTSMAQSQSWWKLSSAGHKRLRSRPAHWWNSSASTCSTRKLPQVVPLWRSNSKQIGSFAGARHQPPGPPFRTGLATIDCRL